MYVLVCAACVYSWARRRVRGFVSARAEQEDRSGRAPAGERRRLRVAAAPGADRARDGAGAAQAIALALACHRRLRPARAAERTAATRWRRRRTGRLRAPGVRAARYDHRRALRRAARNVQPTGHVQRRRQPQLRRRAAL